MIGVSGQRTHVTITICSPSLQNNGNPRVALLRESLETIVMPFATSTPRKAICNIVHIIITIKGIYIINSKFLTHKTLTFPQNLSIKKSFHVTWIKSKFKDKKERDSLFMFSTQGFRSSWRFTFFLPTPTKSVRGLRITLPLGSLKVTSGNSRILPRSSLNVVFFIIVGVTDRLRRKRFYYKFFPLSWASSVPSNQEGALEIFSPTSKL